MKLTLLGTGTPAPSLKRQSSGYLLEIGDDVIVLDHGPGAAHRLLESGHCPSEVTHLFFSHLHYDHIADYSRLLLQRWDQGAGKIPELNVYGPGPIARITDQLFGKDGVYALDLESRVSHQASKDIYAARGGEGAREKPYPKVREIKAGDSIEGETWRNTVGSARQFQHFLECLAFRIESKEGTIVYSGDSGGVLESMVELATDCDVLIHMCHFASGTEPSEVFRTTCGGHMDVAEIARKANVKTLVLTHIIPMLDEPGVMEKLVSEMSGVYNGNIVVGSDLLNVPLTLGHSPKID